MKRKAAADQPAARSRPSFADYLEERAAPLNGWHADAGHAARLCAILYVTSYNLAPDEPPYEFAASLARAYLSGAAS